MKPLELLARLQAVVHVTEACRQAAQFVPQERYDEMTVALARLLACIAGTSGDDAIKAAHQANAEIAAKKAAEREGMS